MSELLDIAALKQVALHQRISARVHGQIDALQQKVTSSQKPFYELSLVDGGGKLTLRAWSDSPSFAQCAALKSGQFVEIEGEFSHNGSFGLDAKGWTVRLLTDEEKDEVLIGPVALREKQATDYAYLVDTLATLREPRLKALTALFLAEYGERFRRTAAARNYHHARRGGLVEHVAGMMRAAVAIAGAYPHLHRDLLLAGVLFHDCGKLWENAMPENGFTMAYDELGEMLGHITIGIELANALWRKLPLEDWRTEEPSSEEVRRHLLHLIASHHGSMEFGSPVDPKTPEAWALHYIDNLDAKLEMFAKGYETAAQIAPRIFERVRPLPGNLVAPLPL